MVDSIDAVSLHYLLLLEVNYQYQSRLRDEAQRPPLCLLLLGHVLEGQDTYEISRAIELPLHLHVQGSQDGQFRYDEAQVRRRIKLVREVSLHLELCGIMVVNDKLYDYEGLVGNFVHEFGTQTKYFFTYEPELDAEIEYKLSGFQLTPSKQRIGYRLEHGKVPISTKESHAVASQLSDLQRMEQQVAFQRRLATEIDKMIRYLDCSHPSDVVLRKISMLVCQLRRGTTRDIEETIMNKEGEIDALRTICEQWEMGTAPSD